MAAEIKRQNFNITPEQEAELTWLRDTLGASSTKDAILLAVRVLAILAREVQRGHALYLGTESGPWTRLLIPELQPPASGEWTYLVARPHPWRRQLFVRGRNLTVGHLVMTMRANRLTPEQAAEELDLPIEAVRRELGEFAAQQDHAKQVLEEHAFLLGQIARPHREHRLQRRASWST